MRVPISAFSRGEIAPTLYGRVDTNLYQLALRKAKNTIIHVHGGAMNRGGLHYLGPQKDHTRRARVIAFQFKLTDTHQLEFGHEYLRIWREDAPVTEDAVDVLSVTAANPVVVTTDGAHGYSTGDEVYLEDIGGMWEVNQERWTITVVSPTTFSLTDQLDGSVINGLLFTPYTSGGTVARIYELVTPYQEDDLLELTYAQSADVMTLTHKDYPTYELRRLALSSWTLTPLTYGPSQAAPSAVAAAADTVGAETVRYQVTAVAHDTQEESLPGLSATAAIAITAITKANPAVVTTGVAHGLADGNEIRLASIVGMTELNGRRAIVYVVDPTRVQLREIDSTDFAAYVSGGTVTRAFAVVTNSTTSFENTITWAAVTGASRYDIYREKDAIYGFIGSSNGLSFTDEAALKPDLVQTPPQERNPFFGAGNYPGAIGSHQQRRVFGGSNNRPDTSFYSRTGTQANFSVSTPTRDDDAITATLPAAEINQIRHYVSFTDLLIFTSGGEWVVTYNANVGFTATSISQSQRSAWGSALPRPLIVGTTVLWVTFGGVMIRSLASTFEIDQFRQRGVTGELSLLIPHLLLNDPVLDWATVKQPTPLVVVVQASGRVLCCTIEEEQQVLAWCWWETQGTWESVASSRATPTAMMESVYCLTRRVLNGRTVRSLEKLDNRQADAVEDAFFVDCGLSYDEPWAVASLTLTNPLVLMITGHPFVDGDTVDLVEFVWDTVTDEWGTQTQPAQLNGFRYTVANATTDTFTLLDIDDGTPIDGTAFLPYVSGGVVRKAVDTLVGFRHLAGMEVIVLADGNVLPAQTVSPLGELTFDRRFSRVHGGLAYTSDLETLDLEIPGAATLQGTQKRVPAVTVRFAGSGSLWAGPTFSQMTEIRQRESEAMGEPNRLFTGEKRIPLHTTWNAHGRLAFRQRDPLPMTILAVTPEVDPGD